MRGLISLPAALLLAITVYANNNAVLRERYAPLNSLTAFKNLQDPATNLDFTASETFLSQILIPRMPESANLTKVQNLIHQKFAALAKRSRARMKAVNDDDDTPAFWFEVVDQFTASTPIGDRTFTNQVFTHNPQADLKLVLACHTDSKYAPPDSPDAAFVGATDSAVPCAVILDVAEALSDWLDDREISRRNGKAGGRSTTLSLVFLDGEEAFQTWTATDSIYGARHLAHLWASDPVDVPTPGAVRPPTAIAQISHFVLLDLLGSPQPIIRNFYHNTGWLFDAYCEAEDALGSDGFLWQGFKGAKWQTEGYKSLTPGGPRTRSFFQRRDVGTNSVWGGHIEDDHLPFLRAGVPILHLIPVPFPQVWHTLKDDITCLDYPTVRAWSLLTRLVVAQYLGLGPSTKRILDELVGKPTFSKFQLSMI